MDVENRRFYLLFLRLIWDFARDWLQQKMLYLILMHFIVDLAQKWLREKIFTILRWNRIQSYARLITYSWIAMSAKFPCVSKRPIVPGIIDLSKFVCEDLEEIVAGGQGSFKVYCRTQVVTNKQTNKQTNIHTYIHTYIPTMPMPLLFTSKI